MEPQNSLLMDLIDIDEMSELKLERRLRRDLGESNRDISDIGGGGIFSLLAVPSSGSRAVTVRLRLVVGVDAGVIIPVDLLETTDEERESDARFPRTLVAVCDRVRRRVDGVDDDGEGMMTDKQARDIPVDALLDSENEDQKELNVDVDE